MHKLIPFGSLFALVIVVFVALTIAGAFDDDDPQASDEGVSAVCAEGFEDCEDTVVIPNTDESDDVADLPISDDIADTDEGEALAIEAAFAALEALGGPPASEFDDIEVRAVTWNDACLGVETPGIACAQVITPGYVVLLDNGLLGYEFHTDTNGNAILANLPR